MKLSVIIPCYNEEATIEKIVTKINKVTEYEKEIIVVDDFSQDKSFEILNKLYQENKIQFLAINKKNFGKGYSLRKGIEMATGEIIIFQDADLEYEPDDYPKLVKPITEDLADVVFGSRFSGSDIRRVLFFWHSMGNYLLTFLSNMFSNLNLTDMENCYKVFRSQIIKNIDLKEDRFGFEPEVTAKIAKKDLRIYEVGVKYYGRKYSEGKKITWKDGFSAIRCIEKYNIFN